jgi:predicted nucleic acid-binding protein
VNEPFLLLDTSAAVALLVADHTSHGLVHEQIGHAVLGLSGHAAFESYSVLTRLPAPVRQPPATVARLLSENFPATRHLPSRQAAALVSRLPELGIAGGAVYDALVAATARHHDAELVTLDDRALPTYHAIGVTLRVLGPTGQR